jgi:glutamate--cysteine ligase regulatory subunit
VFTSAINFLMSTLGTDYIDSLTLALPPSRKKSIEEMKSIWTCAVTNVINGSIKDLGVSDLDAGQLEELYAWAEEVKPITNQINLETCCVIPPELNEFAKLKNIRLLTHNDPRDILPKDKLTPILSAAGFPDAADYRCLWIGRYSVLITANGVIESKGFVVAIVKD